MQSIDTSTWLKNAAAEVLETMCFSEIVGPAEELPAESTDWVSSTLTFSGGPDGAFGICTPYAVAQTLAANLLGEDADAIDRQQAADSLGEIANMICGGLLHQFARDCAYDLTHPVSAFSLALPGPGATVERFQLDEGPVCVWADME